MRGCARYSRVRTLFSPIDSLPPRHCFFFIYSVAPISLHRSSSCGRTLYSLREEGQAGVQLCDCANPPSFFPSFAALCGLNIATWYRAGSIFVLFKSQTAALWYHEGSFSCPFFLPDCLLPLQVFRLRFSVPFFNFLSNFRPRAIFELVGPQKFFYPFPP